MKTIPYSQFKHGQRCTCEIDGKKVTNAKISIDSHGDVYVCQNVVDGADADNMLGYKYSVWLAENTEEQTIEICSGITNLVLLPRTIEDVEEGDMVVNMLPDEEQKVLSRCGDVIFLSINRDHTHVHPCLYTPTSLKENGYTIKQDTPPEEENRTYKICGKCLDRLTKGLPQEDNHVGCEKVIRPTYDQLRIKE